VSPKAKCSAGRLLSGVVFIKTLHLFKTNAFVSITLARLVAPILILPPAALSDRVGRRAPAYYVVAAAIAA
jgi:hypothetical protein